MRLPKARPEPVRLITKTPRGWSGTVLELALGFCSRSIVIGRHWYVFKRGRGLLRLPARFVRGVSRPGARLSAADRAALDARVGRPWSVWSDNCAVTFNPYWREGRAMPPRDRASSADDRNAIVRAILTALVVGVLVLVGAGTVIDRAFITPLRADIAALRADIQQSRGELGDQIMSARQSAAAHFGQIKSILKETRHETGSPGGADQ